MSKQQAMWQFISSHLAQGVPVMLLYVLESRGSSPGRQGFAMAVSTQGGLQGSIGGGIMEHKFVEMAREKLKNARQETTVRKQVHNKSAPRNQSGMICSGEQTVLLYQVKPQEADTVQQLMAAVAAAKNGLLSLSPQGLSFAADVVPAQDFSFTFVSEQEWLYQEKTGYRNHLYLIGGGHCALALSRLMHSLDFYIHLFEDRAELNTIRENSYVQEKTVVRSYEELADRIPSGENHYVVIMTFGYRTDDLAFRALLNKKFRYLGLLGSRSKIKKMFTDYAREGIRSANLEQAHAPVGLPINSQTPEEIAVSIAAQIIQVKNQQLQEKPAATTGKI